MNFFYLFFLSFLATITVSAQVLDGVKLNEACKPAIVCIFVPNGSGSGFIIEKNGYIVTNYHVIRNKKYGGVYWAGDIIVELSDGKKEVCTEIVRTDENNDLALLRIKQGTYTSLPILPTTEKNGTRVAAFGSPFGRKVQFNEGTISNVDLFDREKNLPDTGRIQVDISLSVGNSGGPIVNKNGQVVAVTHAKSKQGENINFAIKSTVLINFLNKENIKFSTTPLITDDELKLSTSIEMTEAERRELEDKNIKAMQGKKQVDKAQTDAEIAAIKEEQKTKREEAEAERYRIEVETKNKLYLEQMSTQQREDYLKQQALQQKAYSARQHELSIESLEEQNKRRQMKLDQDVLAQAQLKQQYRKDLAAYYYALPQRFSSRVGLGATYYVGTLGVSNSSAFEQDNIGLAGDVSIAYRLDRKGNNRRSRATSIGGGLKFGAWNSPTASKIIAAQNWNSNYANLRNEHLFLELSGGFLLREWFKIDGGYGQQYIYANNDIYTKNYGVMTLGFIARFGAVELEATASGLFLANFEKPTLRANLQLVYHAKWGKF